MNNVVFFDHDNQHTRDALKIGCTQAISASFDNVILMGPPSDAYDTKKSSDYIKGSDLVIVWNNLKPTSIWAIDLCKRFNVPCVIVERGIVPSQGTDNYSFFSGGICFDNTNLIPERTTENYEENVSIIKSHYASNNLSRQSIDNKIVVVGQLDFDSTMTHYTDIPSWSHLIEATSQRFPDHEIVFCKHPRDTFTSVDVRTSEVPTIEECLSAKAVVLVSSTISYELAGLDIPLAIAGRGQYKFPLLRGWTKPLECQATALDYHFNTSSSPERIRDIIKRTIT